MWRSSNLRKTSGATCTCRGWRIRRCWSTQFAIGSRCWIWEQAPSRLQTAAMIVLGGGLRAGETVACGDARWSGPLVKPGDALSPAAPASGMPVQCQEEDAGSCPERGIESVGLRWPRVGSITAGGTAGEGELPAGIARIGAGVDRPRFHQSISPNHSRLGLFFSSDRARSRVLSRVRAEGCGLRRPPPWHHPGSVSLCPGRFSLRPRSHGWGRSSQGPGTIPM